MRNPWLDIPLADYEQHMALPSVGQAALLSDAVAASVSRYRPRSMAIVGCAGGNGFERVVDAGVHRVIGIDINESYVRSARQRFGDRIPGLELIVGDVETTEFAFDPVDLVFAGLLFEYVDTRRTLGNIRSLLVPGGILTAVLQLPSELPSVTPSPYRSLESLSSILRLVPPEAFAGHAEEAGFAVLPSEIVTAKGGKKFFVCNLRA